MKTKDVVEELRGIGVRKSEKFQNKFMTREGQRVVMRVVAVVRKL